MLRDLEEFGTIQDKTVSFQHLLRFDENDFEDESKLNFQHFEHIKMFEFLNSVYGLDYQDSYGNFDFDKLYTVYIPEDDLKLVRRAVNVPAEMAKVRVHRDEEEAVMRDGILGLEIDDIVTDV